MTISVDYTITEIPALYVSLSVFFHLLWNIQTYELGYRTSTWTIAKFSDAKCPSHLGGVEQWFRGDLFISSMSIWVIHRIEQGPCRTPYLLVLFILIWSITTDQQAPWAYNTEIAIFSSCTACTCMLLNLCMVSLKGMLWLAISKEWVWQQCRAYLSANQLSTNQLA